MRTHQFIVTWPLVSLLMLINFQGYLKFLSTLEKNHSHEDTHILDNCHINNYTFC